jgi:DNA-binding GntR family transcriptional regulator
LEDINEIFDILFLLEGMAARKASDCEDEDLRTALRGALERMKQTAEADDPEGWRQADDELHRVVFAMCRNGRAARVINEMNEQLYRVRIGLVVMAGRMKRSNQEHEAIVAGILDGDGGEAEQQMHTHLRNLREELTGVLVNLVLPFATNGV